MVIGLLPYNNDEKSIYLLFEREKNRRHFKEIDKQELINKTREDYHKLLLHMEKICKYVVYTEKRSPEMIAKEIIKLIGKPSNI